MRRNAPRRSLAADRLGGGRCSAAHAQSGRVHARPVGLVGSAARRRRRLGQEYAHQTHPSERASRHHGWQDGGMNRVCRRGAPLVVVLAILAATNCACCSPTSHHGERCFLEIGPSSTRRRFRHRNEMLFFLRVASGPERPSSGVIFFPSLLFVAFECRRSCPRPLYMLAAGTG